MYVRLRGDKLQESELYSRIHNEMSVSGKGGIGVAEKHEKENKTRQVFSCLTQGGFTFFPPGEVMPFAVENIDRLMYISSHDGKNSWGWDTQVDPQLLGCVTVKEDKNGRISIFPSNPEPRWIQCDLEKPSFPSNAVKAHQKASNVTVCLAKVGNPLFLFLSEICTGLKMESYA